MHATESPDAKHLGERFNPFHDLYLADPYPFFAEAQRATPVFYSPLLDYWVVTRYHDIRQVFQTPYSFSNVNVAFTPRRIAAMEPFIRWRGEQRDGIL